jgi:Protein of unknown function (DUF1552)
MTSHGISRRSLIRGAGGIAIALPALEIMGGTGSAYAATAAKPKLITMFAGGSLGSTGGAINPSTAGVNYEITTLLKSIDKYKVKPHVGVVTGLKIPRGSGAACIRHTGDIYHRKSILPVVAGETCTEDGGDAPKLKGSTVDQIVAAKLGVKNINLRIQPVGYAGGTDSGDDEGNRMTGKNGSLTSPYSSPRVVFDTFISAFKGAAGGGGTSTGTSTSPELLAARAKHKSVLDLVDGGASRLMKRLGAGDLKTMQAHLEFIRQLEKDIDGIETRAMTSSCTVPTAPGTDPGLQDPGSQAGWSDETARGQAMARLMALGLACDLWNVGTLQVSFSQIFVSAKQAAGINTNLGIHQYAHENTGDPEGIARCMAWQVDPFAYLVSLLAAQTDVDGQPMINNTVITMSFEAGFGGEGGDGTHSSSNMVMLYAGKVGGLKPQHIKANNAHPAQVNCAAMKAVGVAPTLGEISTPLAGMFG